MKIKVKDSNAEIVRTDEKLADCRTCIRNYRKELQELQSGMKTTEQMEKYEVLFSKDQEMSKFLETFPKNITGEDTKLKEAQQGIVALLEDISKHVGMSTTFIQILNIIFNKF